MRKITKIRRSIRAISPVISVLLMIVIAVVASLVAYAWVMGYMGFTTTKTGKAIQIQSFAISDDGNLHVYVQNVGQGAVELGAAYINDGQKDFSSPNYPDNKLPEGNTAELVITGPYDANEQLGIKVTTTDGTFSQVQGTGSSSPTANPTSPPGNVDPTAAFTFSATNLVVQFTDASTDSDGTIASRLWAFGDTQTSTGTNPSHTYAAAETYTVKLTVTDNDGATNYVEHPVTVAVGNTAPTLNPIGAKSVNEGALLTFTATATDTDVPAQTLTFSLQGSVPTGAAITTGGVFTWTPDSTQGSTTPYQITVRVTDNGAGALYDEETIAVTVNDVPTQAQVTFVAAGTGSGGTGNLAPAYPTGLQANDLLLLQVTVGDGTTTPTTPSGGWAILYGPDTVTPQYGNPGRQWIYYKFASGSETGTLAITITGYSTNVACIYAFRNVKTSNFAEAASYTGSPTTPASTIPANSVTTTGAKRLAVSFNYVQADFAMGSFTGSTGGTWAQPTGGLTRYNGGFYTATIQLQTATMASAGTISGGTTANYGVQYGSTWYYSSWGVRSFALIPAS